MFVPVPVLTGSAAGLSPDEMRTVHVGERAVLLVNVDGTYHALDDTCTHEDCSLGEGYLEDDTVVCPCHGATFDVHTGAALTLPATVPLQVYPVRTTANGAVEIDLP